MIIRPTLVLDLDGTLADTAPDLGGALNAVLKREGLPGVPPAAIRSMIGQGARALLTRGFEAAGKAPEPARLGELYDQFIDHYVAHIADETRLFPGVGGSLTRFAAAGWQLAVCTNKLEGLSRALLGELGVAPMFAAICGGDTFDCSKPDPRHLTRTIGLAGGNRDCAVMVGDSRTDIVTAKAAGVPVVAVDFGYTDVPVAELGPDVVISHFDALFDAASKLLGADAAADVAQRAGQGADAGIALSS